MQGPTWPRWVAREEGTPRRRSATRVLAALPPPATIRLFDRICVAATNYLFLVLDLYWRSPESGGLRYKSRQWRKTICSPSEPPLAEAAERDEGVGCVPAPRDHKAIGPDLAQGSGFRVQGAGFRVQGSGPRIQGPGFRVQEGVGCVAAPHDNQAV